MVQRICRTNLAPNTSKDQLSKMWQMWKISWAQHAITLVPKVRFCKTFRATVLNERSIRALCLMVPDSPRMYGLKLQKQPVISRIDLQVQETQLHMSCGPERNLIRLDFEWTGVLHLRMSPKRSGNLWKIDLKTTSSLDMDLEIFTGSWPR